MKKYLIENLHEKFCFIPSNLPQMDVSHKGPLTVINSQLATDMFNIVYLNTNAIPNIDEISESIKLFKQMKLPFSFWLTSEEENQIADDLKKLDLICAEDELGMGIDLANIVEPEKTNEGVLIKAVNCENTLIDWINVFCSLLPDECPAITEFYRIANPIIQKFNNKIKCYVGYLNDKPVTTCALFFSENIAGIFDMITIPAAQRKGVATAMMLHALTEAKQAGYKYVSLSASEEGRHVYKKIGFENYCEFKIYTPSY